MNRNGRRIALGLVAIVLGAGFLLKVIPPETDVGINDRRLINIDGSLVSNPLDINELSQLALNPAFTVYSATNQAARQSEDPHSPTDLSPLTETNPFLPALPSTPGIGPGKPPATGTGPKSNHPPGKTDPVDFDQPSTPLQPRDDVLKPVVNNPGSNTPSNPGTGSSPAPTNPDPGTPDPSAPGPIDPAPRNPNPNEPGPIIEVPKTPPSVPDLTFPVPDETSDPLPGVPPIPDENPKSPDYPPQSVPDQGATVAMIGAAVAGLLALNRRVNRQN